MGTEQVDVLGVLDREIVRAGGQEYAVGRELIEARAAIAELLEADREYDEVLERGLDGCSGFGEGRFRKAKQRRAAALARIGGAK